jgi:hypothetical protein
MARPPKKKPTKTTYKPPAKPPHLRLRKAKKAKKKKR